MHGVPVSLGTDQAHVDAVTAPMLADLFRDGGFGESLDGAAPILDAGERSHMRDVAGVTRSLLLLEAIALVALLLSGRRLRDERARRGRLLLIGAGLVGALAVAGGLFFALSFDAAFAVFHSLFFKAGTWQFGPDSNLIRLFPEPFWFQAALLAGASIVLGALLATIAARRDLRAPARGD
jgi:integral membrane protein (TIGR01906 family)